MTFNDHTHHEYTFTLNQFLHLYIMVQEQFIVVWLKSLIVALVKLQSD
jgi:hypothetical protein